MSVRYSKYIKLIHILGDIAAFALSIGVAFMLAPFYTDQSLYYIFLLGAIVSWFACTTLLGTYKIYRVTTRFRVILIAFKALLLYILLVEAGLNILDVKLISRQILVSHYLALIILIVLFRIAVTTALRIYRRRGYNLRKVIIAGRNEMALELEQFFKSHPEFGYEFIGFFHNGAVPGNKFKGQVSDIENFIKQHEVHEIYCCPFELSEQETIKLLSISDDNLLRIKFLPEPLSYTHQQLKMDFYDALPVLMVRAIPLDDVVNKFFKRVFDIVFSLTVVVLLLSWLLPILALLIKVNSKGPVFFKQVRSGLDNKTFNCYKLRTMYVNSEANSQLAQRGDSRITRIGAFLRKTSLDELPQFFNVLFGQMSIVGPRPHMLKADEEYAMVAEKYKVRHFVKPGITGLSQVRGYRGDTTENYQIRGRTKLDIFYLENWSFFLDLKIIFYTIYNVVKGEENAF
ncbi:undecaprenyl-phosphate glucose phosphotransferase [uncultured Pontibacter sp.]|uniref:undecaprenyl-phosphate glucose phosphotransferase n=1 Tax=uncultured Pontibacter sp. TaxID=453356 RepID=UPI002633C8B5|nr:undecaprenyl-phosphate glucose phosphotransferase [uncultured Pontibacter sp.]